MKKIYVLVAIAIIGISWCVSINAVSETIDLGNVDYGDYQYFWIVADHEINLTFISCEYIETALVVEKVDYFPSTNETKYKFKSVEITPDSTFTPGFMAYIYQDSASGQLYQVNVDYSSVIPPPDPWQEGYEKLYDEYTTLNNSYNNLTDAYNNINSSHNNDTATLHEMLDEYWNLTGVNDSDLLEIANEVLSDFSIALNNLNQEILDTKDELESSYESYSGLYGEYNLTTDLLNQTDWKLVNLTDAFNELNASYIQTYDALIETAKNATKFQRFYDEMTSSYKDDFSFEGYHFKTQSGYEREIFDLESDIRMVPLYLVLTVAIMLVICFILIKMWTRREPSSLELEDSFGYSPTANKIDNFINGSKQAIKTVGNALNARKNGKTNVTTKETPPTPPTPIDYNKIAEMIDAAIEKRVAP